MRWILTVYKIRYYELFNIQDQPMSLYFGLESKTDAIKNLPL